MQVTTHSTESPRKVAVFASRFLPYSQTFIYDQVCHHQRYAAHVFARERLNADRFPFSAVHQLTPGRGWIGTVEAAVYRATLLSPTVYRALRDGRFSLLHGHFGSAACYALPYAARFNLPLVVTFHGYDVPLLRSRRRWLPANWPYWALSKWLFRRADLLLPVSEDLASMLVSLGAPADRVRVHRLGVDTTLLPRIERHDGRLIVVMVGRYVEKKGFEDGIRAFASIAASYPAARLIVIGDGPLRSAYVQLIENLGVGGQIDLVPPKPHAELLRTLQSADIALVPSVTGRHGDREGGPLVVREAGVMGLPVIATRHAAIPEVVDHNVTGLLVAERNVAEMAAALRRLLSNPDDRRSLGEAARTKMRREFDRDERMAVLEQHYDDAIRLRRAALTTG